jgi:hypothetical protein
MCSQVRGVVKNFIWGGKDANARAKVKWDTLGLPTTKGGCGVIDPKTQSETLLAKLLIRGLALGGEPWKELLRFRADQIKLPVHGMGSNTQDINWLFAAPKLKRLPYSLWRSIVNAWMNVRPSLCKSEPTTYAELFRQPVFRNPLITNQENRSLGLSGRNKSNAFASVSCSRVRDFWDSKTQGLKSLATLGMNFHPSNRQGRNIIIASIPWSPVTFNSRP